MYILLVIDAYGWTTIYPLLAFCPWKPRLIAIRFVNKLSGCETLEMTSVNEAILKEISVHGELKSRAAIGNWLVDDYYIKRQLFRLLNWISKHFEEVVLPLGNTDQHFPPFSDTINQIIEKIIIWSFGDKKSAKITEVSTEHWQYLQHRH